MNVPRRRPFPLLAAVLFGLLAASEAPGFTYVSASKDPEAVVHPVGYTGRGGELTVTLALHPDFVDMEDEVGFSAEQVAAIWTDLLHREENLGPSLEIPRIGGVDFFGTLIHEVGHTLGLAHPTMMPRRANGSRGVGKFATAEPGPNGRLDLDAGPDGLRGSADDERGDDINAVYFRIADNHPFAGSDGAVYDSTTYSRDPADLPEGDLSPVVSTRENARALYSLEKSEGMMVSGGSLVPGQVRRGLSADDIAGIRYAMSGLDEKEGTGDDYTIRVEYVGVDADADVLIRFDHSSGFAVAKVGTRSIEGSHKAMGRNRIIAYNPNLPGNRRWYFPQPEALECEASEMNERAVRLEIPTEPGVRYGVSWPGESVGEDEDAGDILVRQDGEGRSPISGRLFLFVATEPETTVEIAFPSSAPAPDAVRAFRLTARPAN